MIVDDGFKMVVDVGKKYRKKNKRDKDGKIVGKIKMEVGKKWSEMGLMGGELMKLVL